MRVIFIGDIVGKPGRQAVKEHLQNIIKEHNVDLVVANTENASHGFGLTIKNSKELFDTGIDMMTGGNHTWDKKEIIPLLENEPILRPLNYPQGVPGHGVGFLEVGGEKLAVLNLMGYFTMPMVDNPFITVKKEIDKLKNEGISNILIDIHAEATSEKRALLAFTEGEVSAICGTHTHVGTDDLEVKKGTFYVTDVGLTGCADNVIGMEEKAPLKRFLTGLPVSFDIPKKCKKIFQAVVFELVDGKCTEAYKIKAYDDAEPFVSQKAFIETDNG